MDNIWWKLINAINVFWKDTTILVVYPAITRTVGPVAKTQRDRVVGLHTWQLDSTTRS